MGYTHYWSFTPTASKKNFLKAMILCEKIVAIVQAKDHILANGMGEIGTDPIINGDKLIFNGIGEEAHETFCLDINNMQDFDFCKTAQKPYDKIVVACLAVLQRVMGKDVKVSSDGDEKDWTKGRQLAKQILGFLPAVPAEVKRRS